MGLLDGEGPLSPCGSSRIERFDSVSRWLSSTATGLFVLFSPRFVQINELIMFMYVDYVGFRCWDQMALDIQSVERKLRKLHRTTDYNIKQCKIMVGTELN
ncbi:hypothetical protein F2Q70_00032077 [Brassica cretica]|uniref:Uncharacterized protein n=1 Tax=Brassica cretica TaxID=69181 RepID=A0A8S9FKE9_BRACR|nr:hypothetical protein F2Q70_00032077 [Brassica cretica]